MILGLDVGGTQTDAVLISNGKVVAHSKTVNRPDLLETLNLSLDSVLSQADPSQIRRMVFSTTMATNAIVQDRMEPAGMIVMAGPGMDPAWFEVGPSYHVVPGVLDHRGVEIKPLERSAILGAAASMKKQGVRVAGVTGKFSVRNPLHELSVSDSIGDQFKYVALGHRFSGSLNFPRRIHTTYLNAALYGIHHEFMSALENTLKKRNLTAPSYLLKPDGGTVRLGKSHRFPAQTAQSGPAASVMGALACDGCDSHTLVLDIGGTTTDMAIVVDGAPLCVPQGITLGAFRTNIRSLQTRSIGLGGDSRVRVDDRNNLRIGPQRMGPPMAFGGPEPTPTDALKVLGHVPGGDKEKARQAMEKIGGPLGWDAKTAATGVLEKMGRVMAQGARAFVELVNSRPVYTIHEVLEGVEVRPQAAVVLGGPAKDLSPFVQQALDLSCRVPEHAHVANAVGAATARVTTEVTLQADTRRGTAIIAEVGLETPIGRDFDLDQAMELARDVLTRRAAEEGASEDNLQFTVVEKESFNMVRQGAMSHKNIRLKLSLAPGLISQWNKEAQC